MANPQRGEVALTVGDRVYTLVLDFDAICTLETLLSTPQHLVTLGDVLVAMVRGSYRHIRAFVWAGLRRHHGALTLEQVGTLIEDAGGIEALFAQLEVLKASTQPDPEDRPSRPPTARRPRGTGAPITSTRGASVSPPTPSGG